MTTTIFSSATLNDRTTLSPCTREARQTTLTQFSYNTSNHSAEAALWYYPPEITIVATVAMAMAATAGILLNTLLVMTIQFSPSLKTPPNAHLLNICLNNLLLGLHVLVALPTLHMSGATIRGKTDEVLSGLQLFLVMHCLLQYWGAFASIGFYRFKTLHHPSLSLRVRRQLVSRAIAINWVISLLLAMTFSLANAHTSVYLPWTLDPFRHTYYLHLPREEGSTVVKGHEESHEAESDQVVVMALVLAGLTLGFGVVVTSYYSICRTLNLTGKVGKCRVSPWPRNSASLSSLPPEPTYLPDCGDLALTTGSRMYRPSNNGHLFCVSSDQTPRDITWIVHYQKCDHKAFIQDLLTLENPRQDTQRHASSTAATKRDMYINKRPLTVTLSTGSATSAGKSSNKSPDFSDISHSADIDRLQKLQCRSALNKQSVRRERGNLSSATKNSLAMLLAFFVCSVPLIVCQVPAALSLLTLGQRVMVLLFCRLLFFFNAPVYPLWYLLFSLRVKKCLGRMCEAFLFKINLRR